VSSISIKKKADKSEISYNSKKKNFYQKWNKNWYK
jgi:hypothetical protein